MAKIYISGAISNTDPEQVKKNLEVFNEQESVLRGHGWEVINPASLEGECSTWEEYLARDILILVNERPEVWLINGWEKSQGSRLEVEVAKRLGLKIHYPYER